MSLATTIQKFHQKEVLFRPLVRQLIDHSAWILPSHNKEHPSLWRSPNGIWLSAFTSMETFKQQASESDFITQQGMSLFANLNTPIDAIVIDPGTPYALQFTQKMFPTLKRWSAAINVERILENPQNRSEAATILRDYEGFYIPVIKSDSGKAHLALAPDKQGRKLAAVFTAEDTLQRFLDIAQQALGDDLIIDMISGRKLFSTLYELPLDGVVFNCNGPVKPQALRMQFINYLMLEDN